MTRNMTVKAIIQKNRFWIYTGIVVLFVSSLFFLLFSRTQYLYKQNQLIARRIEELMQRTQELQVDMRKIRAARFSPPVTRQHQQVTQQPPLPVRIEKNSDDISDSELQQELADLERKVRPVNAKDSNKTVVAKVSEETKSTKEIKESIKETKPIRVTSIPKSSRLLKLSSTGAPSTEKS